MLPEGRTDRHEHFSQRLNQVITQVRLTPAPLTSFQHDINTDLNNLISDLEAIKQEDNDYLIERLVWDARQLQRDVGTLKEPALLKALRNRSIEILEFYKCNGELLHLAYALFVETEYHRERFLLGSKNKSSLSKARNWLNAGQYTLESYSGDHQRSADELLIYSELGFICMCNDVEEFESADLYIEKLRLRADVYFQKYGDQAHTPLILYLVSAAEAAHAVNKNNFEVAKYELNIMKSLVSRLPYYPYAAYFDRLHLQTKLAFATMNPDRHDYFQTYIKEFSVCQEALYWNYIQRLQKRFDLPSPLPIVDQRRLYFRPIFIWPYEMLPGI